MNKKLSKAELEAIENREVIEQERKPYFFETPPHLLSTKLLPNKIKFHKAQQEIAESLNKFRFVVTVASRRLGKTEMACACAIAKALESTVGKDAMEILIVAPTYNHTNTLWDGILSKLVATGIGHKPNINNKVIKFTEPFNANIRFVSIMNQEKIVGRGYNFVIVDECALIDSGSYFERGIRPALAMDINARVLFISTPRGEQNYFFDFYQRGLNDEFTDWHSHNFPWYHNPYLDKNDIMGSLADNGGEMSYEEWRQEFFGDFMVFKNQIFPMLDAETMLVDNLVKNNVDKGSTTFSYVFAGMDAGYTDPAAFIVYGYNNGNYAVLDGFKIKEASTDAQAEKIHKMKDKYGIEHIFIDAAAAQQRRDLRKKNLPMRRATKGSIQDSILYCQGLVEKGAIKFDSKTGKEVFKALQAYRWKDNADKVDNPRPHHGPESHYADAFRYGLFSHRPNQRRITF